MKYVVVLALLISMGAQANHLLPDSVWTFKNREEHHHTEANEIWLSADRPGAGTGSEVLDRGFIQWETGFESFNLFDPDALNQNTGKTYTHCHINMDFGLTYAVHPRVQLDAYAGFNIYNSEPSMSYPQNYAFFGFGVTWLIWHPLTAVRTTLLSEQ